MKIKTITGPTIQAALAEARQQLGDNVLLLESVPAEGSRPASIKVVLDPSPSAPVANRVPEPQAVEPVGFGYAAQRRATTASAASTPAAVPAMLRSRIAADAPADAPKTGSAPSPDASSVSAQLQAVQQRLGQLEKVMTRTAPPRAGWRSIPLLRQMESSGLGESSLKRLFERVRSFQEQTGLRQTEAVLIRNELRRMLQMPVLRPAPPALVLVGAAGSGKTSLLLKLAVHEDYFGRRRAAVIVVRPEQAGRGTQSPVELYRQSGLPVQTVTSREEMRLALERVERFDHVLVDTPSLPVAPEAATAFANTLRDILRDLVPLHVQLVLDATRRIANPTLAAWSKLPLRPSSAAVTRLDESHEPGHFAEWLMHLQLPYGYASDGPAIPGDLAVLSASGIAELLTAPASAD